MRRQTAHAIMICDGGMFLNRFLFAAAVVLAWTFPSATTQAQTDLPNRRNHIIVPYPGGGSVNNVTRIVADKLASIWGQPIIVEAKPGLIHDHPEHCQQKSVGDNDKGAITALTELQLLNSCH